MIEESKPATTESEAVALHRSCSSCAFWKAHKFGGSGYCLRNPPQLVAYVESSRDSHGHLHIETHTKDQFPETLAAEWCGEHQTNARGSGDREP